MVKTQYNRTNPRTTLAAKFGRNQQSVGNSFEFIENVKSEFFPKEIYVFTPKGRIVELPMGATAVDFAYAVHSDVGNTCVGVTVEHKPYPLSQAP